MFNFLKKKPKFDIKTQVQVILNDNNVIVSDFRFKNVTDMDYGMKNILKQFNKDRVLFLGQTDTFDNLIPIGSIKRILFKTTMMKEINDGNN